MGKVHFIKTHNAYYIFTHTHLQEQKGRKKAAGISSAAFYITFHKEGYNPCGAQRLCRPDA